jgi:hypothetical protein
MVAKLRSSADNGLVHDVFYSIGLGLVHFKLQAWLDEHKKTVV